MKELQIEHEPKYLSDLFWKIRRFLRAILFVILIAAFFGLFGPGILGQSTISNSQIRISYDKFIRVQNTNVLTIDIKIDNSSQEYIKLISDYSFYEKSFVKSIIPKPIFEIAENNKLIYYFKKPTDADHLNIIMVYENINPGLLKQTLGVEGESNEDITFNQFIYP